MLIERQIEEIFKSKLQSLVDDCEVVGSWCPSDDGTVKGENDTSKKGVISIYISPRAHDNFSLPTVVIDGSIGLQMRVEMCPTMKEVSETYEKVMGLIDYLHYEAQTFSTDFSFDDFYATEIKLNGGDKVNYNRENNCWEIFVSFSIKGCVNRF